MAHWHTVRQGESLPSIAERYGFADWSVIYDHDENGVLRALRSDPNVLSPGDKVFIPNKEQKYVEIATEQRHRFQLKRKLTQVRLVLEAEDGTIFGGKRYRLAVGNLAFEGRTDADGLLEEYVPAIADQGVLTAWIYGDDADAVTWELEIGYLDPIEELSGVQARLNNLGFEAGPETGDLTEQTRNALRLFQLKYGLDTTGQPDEATCNKLVDVHGS